MVIYLRKYLHVIFHLSGVTALYARVLHSPAGPPLTKAVLATIKLVWTALILNGNKASEPLTNDRIGYSSCIARRCIKSFEG